MDFAGGQNADEPVPPTRQKVVSYSQIHAWQNRQHDQKPLQLGPQNAHFVPRIHRLQAKEVREEPQPKVQRHLQEENGSESGQENTHKSAKSQIKHDEKFVADGK